MGEDYTYFLNDFEYDILKCYIKHGFGEMKVYQTSFFTVVNDEQVVLTLNEYYERCTKFREEATQ